MYVPSGVVRLTRHRQTRATAVVILPAERMTSSLGWFVHAHPKHRLKATLPLVYQRIRYLFNREAMSELTYGSVLALRYSHCVSKTPMNRTAKKASTEHARYQ